jgi:hypothetical protein
VVGVASTPPIACLEEIEKVKRNDDDKRNAHGPSNDALHLKLLVFALRRGIEGVSVRQTSVADVIRDQDCWGQMVGCNQTIWGVVSWCEMNSPAAGWTLPGKRIQDARKQG